ncbi:MAG: MFS transporter [Paracoccaceae bacterium]|nr:MFS transporter [Paracoccaceae bacterium]
MSQTDAATPASPRPVAVLLGAMATQGAAAVGFWAYSLLAPELARETGLNERDFGLAVSFIFLGTFFSSPFTGLLAGRFGGMGAIALVLIGMAAAMLLNLAALWSATMLSAFLFGLFYGPQGAVSMTLVAQSAERRMRGLFLSIRHSSVPAAAAVIGRLLPPLMLIAGWQMGVYAVALVLVAGAAFAWAARPLFRLGGEGRARVAERRSFWLGIRGRFRVPAHLRFLWGAGQIFAITQTAVTFFSYLYLLEVAGLDPVAAGIFASNLHLTALLGRPVLGWLCDRTERPHAVLAGIAVVTVITVGAMLNVGPDTPVWLLVPLAVACGVSGQCWNPVFVTAMSFEVADDELAEMNGRAFSFLSIGWMGTAPVFWALIEFTGGYVVPYIIIALANLGVIAVLMRGGKGEK